MDNKQNRMETAESWKRYRFRLEGSRERTSWQTTERLAGDTGRKETGHCENLFADYPINLQRVHKTILTEKWQEEALQMICSLLGTVFRSFDAENDAA